MTKVVFQDSLKNKSIYNAVSDVFEAFGGGKGMLKSSQNVYLKVNAIDFKPYVYTSVEVVEAAAKYFFNCGAKNVYIIENSTQGNITRLVFDIIGMNTMCKKIGAIPIFLDETDQIPMFLPILQSFVQIPDFVNEHLIQNRKDNLYISIPKLKTHSMTTVTLGIKNQFGLIHHMSRIHDHNFRLHQKLADIYANIQPDFTLVDGIFATNYGHYPAFADKEKCVIPMNVIFGGNDSLAVDIVGAKFLGFDIEEVEHLKLCAQYKIGESNFEKIEIENSFIFKERKQKFSCELLEEFPSDITIIRGKKRCCREGCKRNTEAVLEVFAKDFKGTGGFTILMGKGIDKKEIENIKEKVHIAGDCAISEWYQYLSYKLGKHNITVSTGCNNLAETINSLTKWMNISPLNLVPIGIIESLKLLIIAKFKGTKANIPLIIPKL
ncbi:MAG: DUF362 domain-containing protein [Desulfobacterales bacterium]|nr:DUF362 domain-containing protein [Desulfobacterales bacterium]MBF0396641.1 DUF362 domain-containing protein [Desulfobacterales bacterium]